MGNIIGTIITVKEYLSTQKVSLAKDQKGNDYENIYVLDANRCYNIPDYQREIRWEKENVIELMTDLNYGDKFLGNIILAKTKNGYDIIDGQQRTMIFILLLKYIDYKYGKELQTNIFTNFKNESFVGLNKLLDVNFDVSALTDEEKNEIKNSDFFNQEKQLQKLWKCIKESEFLDTSHKAEKFLNNLNNSEINIIVNTKSNNSNYSISYFLDVNVKGVKLDNEDIFKGYLFSKDSSDDIKQEWNNLKSKSIKLDLQEYSVMEILNQYFHCQLYKHCEGLYSKLEYAESFTIKRDVTLGDGNSFHKGYHLINIINNKTYMLESLKKINNYLDIVLDIIKSSEGPSQHFKQLFKTLDNDEQNIIFKLITFILKDNVNVPKSLLMKYFFECVIERGEKNELRKIYAVFMMYVIFVCFYGRKGMNEIISIIGKNDWYEALINKIHSSLNVDKKSYYKAAIKVKCNTEDISDGSIDEKYRCRAIAAVYNCFTWKSNELIVNNYKNLKKFLCDNDTYTIEHFLVNDSGTYIEHENPGKQIKYKYITKYKKFLFNFIILNDEVNGKLSNKFFTYKFDELKSAEIDCQYSKMVYQILKAVYNKSYKKKFASMSIDEFCKNEFKNYYNDCVDKIIEKIITKFKENVK